MEEIYWITRLDGINTLFIVLLMFSMGFTVISVCGYLVTKDDSYNKCWKEFWEKIFKYCCPTTIIVSLLFVFIPTTKEAFAIWGVGSTIDYVRSNETIRQLPDKVVNALDVWVDNYTKTDSIK